MNSRSFLSRTIGLCLSVVGCLTIWGSTAESAPKLLRKVNLSPSNSSEVRIAQVTASFYSDQSMEMTTTNYISMGDQGGYILSLDLDKMEYTAMPDPTASVYMNELPDGTVADPAAVTSLTDPGCPTAPKSPCPWRYCIVSRELLRSNLTDVARMRDVVEWTNGGTDGPPLPTCWHKTFYWEVNANWVETAPGTQQNWTHCQCGSDWCCQAIKHTPGQMWTNYSWDNGNPQKIGLYQVTAAHNDGALNPVYDTWYLYGPHSLQLVHAFAYSPY